MERINSEYAWITLAGRRVIVCLKDGYPNGSRAIQEMGREYKAWRRTSKTKRYLEEVCQFTGLELAELLRLVKGGTTDTCRTVSGTYVHPLIFTHMMQWVSPSFGLAVANWIEEWKRVEGNTGRFWVAVGAANTYECESPEAEVQEQLASQLGAQREVECRSGRIDLLTDRLLIEVKCIDDWKCGLGQLVAYGLDYPERERVLYLYDSGPEKFMREAAASVGIRIAWKPEQLV